MLLVRPPMTPIDSSSVPSATTVARQFARLYGHAPSVLACAPGRVEFIGNHTDYNGGAVLGAAINRHVWVAAGPGASGRLRLASSSAGGVVTEVAADDSTRRTGSDSWVNYPLGVWHALAHFGLPRPAGCEIFVDTDLPAGAGLSSSAALELGTALVLLRLAGGDMPGPEVLAQVARRAENEFVGVPCGLLDQGTIAWAQPGRLVHLDCRGPVYRTVPFPAGAALRLFDTRHRHALVDGMYARRRGECTEAARLLGVEWLASLTPEEFQVHSSMLSGDILLRARHVVEEQARVVETIAALAAGDLARVGGLLTASHRSSQHCFGNTTPELDFLVDRLTSRSGVLGARLTGGGFGGAVMALVTPGFAAAAGQEVAAEFVQAFGHAPVELSLEVSGGAGLI